MDSIKIEPKSYLFRTLKKIRLITVIITILGGLIGFLFSFYTKNFANDMVIRISPYVSIFYGLLFGALISYRQKK